MEDVVLIINSNETNRGTLSSLFREKHKILYAPNGKSGLQLAEKYEDKLSAVLLDLTASAPDGSNLLQEWHRMPQYQKIPVLAIHLKNQLEPMTGLLNKTTAEQYISDALAQTPKQNHALLVIDIDNFKAVNDTRGHLAGDEVIKSTAQALRHVFRKNDTIGRIGGDEFVVFMEDVPNETMVEQKAGELAALLETFSDVQSPLHLSVSIGYAMSEQKEISYTRLFEKADKALHQAKQNGKAQSSCYHSLAVAAACLQHRTILVISQNRTVSSVIPAFLPKQYHVVNISDITEISKVSNNTLQQLSLVYIDISDMNDHFKEYWKKINQQPVLNQIPAIAICDEKRFDQLSSALLANTADILTLPLEVETFKRRTFRHLQ